MTKIPQMPIYLKRTELYNMNTQCVIRNNFYLKSVCNVYKNKKPNFDKKKAVKSQKLVA